jgi:hypothetical protein
MVANVLGFPPHFGFPAGGPAEGGLGMTQQYKLLGNSSPRW